MGPLTQSSLKDCLISILFLRVVYITFRVRLRDSWLRVWDSGSTGPAILGLYRGYMVNNGK